MKAKYVQRGESLDFKNTTGDMIAAGDVLVLGTRIGVAGTDIVPGGLGTVHVDGVYEIAKEDKVEMTVGTEVYFAENGITTMAENEATTTAEDGATTTTEDGAATTVKKNVRAGFVAMDSEAGSDMVCVKINA